jgi:hypothetical protein
MENNEDNLKRVCQYFLDRECTFSEAMDMTNKCPELLTMSNEELSRKVTLMFNSDTFYGIVICNQNEYHEFLSSTILKDKQQKGESYVVKNLVETVDKQYLQKIMGIVATDTLEEKLCKMKQSNFNYTGYKVK